MAKKSSLPEEETEKASERILYKLAHERWFIFWQSSTNTTINGEKIPTDWRLMTAEISFNDLGKAKTRSRELNEVPHKGTYQVLTFFLGHNLNNTYQTATNTYKLCIHQHRPELDSKK